MLRKYFSLGVLLDNAGDGSGGGAPAAGAGSGSATPPSSGSGAGAGATPGAGAGAGTGAAGGGADSGAAAAAAAAKGFTYQEDRSKWLPPHVGTRMAEKVRELQAAHEANERRVRALMGIDSPPDPRNEAILKGLAGMHPALARILTNPNADKVLDRLFQMVESGQVDELGGTSDRVWKQHAHRMTSQAQEQYAKAVGVTVDKLPERAVNRLAREMKAYIDEDRTGDRLSRYEIGDPGLISDFIKDLTGFYVEPVRRQFPTRAAAAAARVQGLPASGRGASGTPSGAGGGGGQKLSKKERFAKMREGFLDATSG
jgi:hypothetical protein